MANVPCIVMVLVKTTPEYCDELTEMSKDSVGEMKKLPGFIAHTLLVNDEKSLIVSRIEWQSKANHENCHTNSCWDETRKQWAKFLDTGKATMEVHVLDVIQRVEASAVAK